MAKTMTLQSILLFYITLISIFSISIFSSARVSNVGFTIDLIHRDSPQSPSYDPSLTPSQRLANALRRSYARLHSFKAKIGLDQSPQSDIIYSNGDYLMNYSVGTPPVHSLAIADTGSDTMWTQCQPCERCFKQTLPFFIPKNSSTFKRIPCKSVLCKSTSDTYCSKKKKNCLYDIMYADGSDTTGVLATETITLGSTSRKRVISFPNIVFGCGFNNAGQFYGGESGVIGLGGGTSSLVSQLSPSIKGKFSYCLMPLSQASSSSKLNFGANAVVSGKGVVSTPLLNKKADTFYYLTLEGISVGNQRLELNGNSSDPKANNKEGNIIIDSGTTLTFIQTDLYNKMLNTFKRVIKLKQIKDPTGDQLDLCFFTRNDIEIPDVTIHFKGADVKLKAENVFVRQSETALCLAFGSAEELGVYGNIAQANFWVGYDLEKKTVSFKAKDCRKP